MPSSAPSLKANVLYKRLPGVLELTQTLLLWTQEAKQTPSLTIPLTDANALFCSKEGAAQIKLKIGIQNDEQGHNFTFTSAPPAALAQRNKFKNELTNVIARNKQSESRQVAASAQLATLGKDRAHKIASNESTPSSPATSTHQPTMPSVQSRANSRSRTPTVQSTGMSPEDFRLCKKVLLKNAQLADLHQQLVMTGQISEAEFWDGRQQLLQAEVYTENQKQGRPSKLVDPRLESSPSGEVKIVITPQLVHDIFEEFPIVAKAYAENVPNSLSESTFWQRYFQSKLFHSHQASIRSSATQHVVKADAIFDKYLRQTDDGVQPLSPYDGIIEKVIDLEATEEDHIETGNRKDVTMQAGQQKGAIPLIRRFNEHSERLLTSAMGEEPAAKKRRVGSSSQENPYIEYIDLEDLHDTSNSAGVLLNIQQRQQLFEGASSNRSAVDKHKVGRTEGRQAKLDNLLHWPEHLAKLTLDKKAADRAMFSMTEVVKQRLSAKAGRNAIPDSIFSQMATCQTAANEFLRQFWLCWFPPGPDSALAAQKAAKAAKIAGYLRTTPEKVDAIVHIARAEGVDGSIVEKALDPLLTSVQRALDFHESRR